MDRRTFLKSASVTAAAASLPQSLHAATPQKPNVLFIMADQWRRPAFSYRAEDPAKTPVLDALAKESMVFTHAYCCSPLCVPSRGGMMTGRYPQTTGILGRGAIKKDEITIAHAFRDAGYTTGYIGKWHLAGPQPRKDVTPEFRGGFEYWCGNNCSHDNFQMHHTDTAGNPVKRQGYVPDMETDYAIDYIKANKAKPFLLVVSWAPPHPGSLPPKPGASGDAFVDGETGMYAAPKVFTDLYRNVKVSRPNIEEPKMSPNTQHVLSEPDVPPPAGYYGAIASLDLNVARLLKTLETEGLKDNTIVVFTSDHGEMMMSHGLFGKKVWWEESIGVPFMVRWPGKVRPGVCHELLSGIDYMPTLVSLAGAKVPATAEGHDFSPAIRGRKMDAPDAVFTSIFDETAMAASTIGWRGVRTKKYLYAVVGGHPDRTQKRGKGAAPTTEAHVQKPAGPPTRYLFDMDADPYQMKPLDTTATNPDAEMLRVKLKAWLVERKDPFAEVV